MISSGLLLNKINEALDQASTAAMSYYGKVHPELKSDWSYLTEADLEIEMLLRDRLPKIIKGSAVVGEETSMDGAERKRVGKTEWVWVIDPIDGTSSFIDRLPNFCISVGLARNGMPYAGAIRFPAYGDRYEGVIGHGAFYNGAPISMKKNKPLKYSAALYVYSEYHRRFDVTYPGKIRNLGSTAGHLVFVARGAGMGVLANASVWDYMGAAPIFLEAGGVIRHIDGSRVNWPAAVLEPDKLKSPIIGAPSGMWKEVAAYIQPVKK